MARRSGWGAVEVEGQMWVGGMASWVGAPGVQEDRHQCGGIHWIEFNLVLLTFLLNSRGRVVGPGMGAGGKEQRSLK